MDPPELVAGEMSNSGDNMPEGRVIYEEVDASEVQDIIGDFNLAEFFDDVIPEGEKADDEGSVAEVAILDPSGGEVSGFVAASSVPSELEDQKWKAELKKDEFKLKTREEMKDFVESTRNPNTVRKTKQVVTAFQRWLSEFCQEDRPIETMNPGELDGFLSNYLLTKEKKDGGHHQADTLTSIHRGVLRHLKYCDYPIDPMSDESFDMSREVLSSRRSKLKQEGFGNRPNRALSLDDEEIDRLWSAGALGHIDPRTLQNTVYFLLVLGFGLRGCDESRKMMWGDVDLLTDKDGNEYLEFTERSSKTRQGGDGAHVRAFAPKIFATRDDRCPIAFYKAFSARRPQKSMHPNSPFYLTVRQGSTLNDNPAYLPLPTGINKLRQIVKGMCEVAGIPGRHTNHSIRKTTCQTLLASNVPPTMVAQLSGHKNLASLNNYAVATSAQQKSMSHILMGKRPEPTSNESVEPPVKRPAIAGPSSRVFPPVGTVNPSVSVVNPPRNHDGMLLPGAPAAMSLPRPHPLFTPVRAEHTDPESTLRELTQNASSMFYGAYVNGPINLNINYNVQSNAASTVNVSPKLPPIKDDE